MDGFVRRILVFLEFLVFAFFLGVIEDIIVVLWGVGETFSWKIFVIVGIVTIPFALVGEFLVDKTTIVPRKSNKYSVLLMKFSEFFVFGFLLSLTEDLLVVLLATNHTITWGIVGICTLIALPFALFSEFVIDKIRVPIKAHISKIR